ncbi:MAG: carbonic anhydrase [Candidatus Cohnella colombiensis]|uniref:carbonic anhydrase n=1 Tax=Candidatus Cohnella colombiensis TaxID=3121368 RepID=A0AA95J9V4_9BACL|nr:MAG: carbonic anhydrase [Cohnella sp.]
MSIVEEMLKFNQQFVEQEKYVEFLTDGLPNKKIAILTCMDTRMTELLPKALNLRNGDAKIIKNAGAILTQPFGSAMRSILVSIYEMGVKEVFVIGHHGCGMTGLDSHKLVEKFKQRGITDSVLETLENSGIRMERFLRGFDNVEGSVQHSIDMIRKHPLIPNDIPVHGFVMHPSTGKLDLISDGYKVLEEQHQA